MSREWLKIAHDLLRQLAAEGWRLIRAFWNWFCELGNGNEREARGLRLLREWLSPEQRAQYDAQRYFDVIGCHSGKRYRIRHGTATNIHELDEAGRPKTGWCFVPRDCVVVGDVLLAQKIALETNERGALAVARSFTPRWSVF
jgi:hypothetical protein